MIYHLFFTMMHFLADAFLRWTRKPCVKIVQTQQFSLEHRDYHRWITPFSGRFDLLLGEGRGNLENLSRYKFKVQAPGRRYLGEVYLFQNLREIISFIKIKVPSTVLKFIHASSDWASTDKEVSYDYDQGLRFRK